MKRMCAPLFAMLMLAVGFPPAVSAGSQCRAASDAMTRPLVELYTSEGCDSCPPADRWLATNFATPVREAGAIALAFHVDYWDRLGWVDRFASAEYTARQYAAMRANGASFAYTPQVIVQGRDYPEWRDATRADVDAAARTPARASLAVEARPDKRSVSVSAQAEVADRALRDGAELFVAYADGGLVSQVTAGENRGVRLAHERVVRALRRVGALDALGRLEVTLDLERPREAGTHPALVAFVQRRSNGDVLQAVALPLDACGVP
jgi:hypothetical protein